MWDRYDARDTHRDRETDGTATSEAEAAAVNGNGGEKTKNDGEIPAIVEVSDDLTSQSAVERVPALR